ncbi:MAG TPA: isopentenyl-diphosphate Delta-isomerase [Parafilimonas sp.]|nr:isopentenyl-diphosphate Delta-isomerase [Parafilimonas sp.]
MEKVILVNEHDEETGTIEKMEAHRNGILHRAFSIFIFNNKKEMLLQQRSTHKYHSGGLWTNACCSHPRPGELTEDAAIRRLREELGFETSLEKIFDFTYRASFENGLTENEFDHVFAGIYNGGINFNRNEVQDVCFRSMQEIESDLQMYPDKFTAWFLIAFPLIKKWQYELTTAVI